MLLLIHNKNKQTNTTAAHVFMYSSRNLLLFALLLGKPLWRINALKKRKYEIRKYYIELVFKVGG